MEQRQFVRKSEKYRSGYMVYIKSVVNLYFNIIFLVYDNYVFYLFKDFSFIFNSER